MVRLNFTIDSNYSFETHHQIDFYEGVYDDPFIKSMIGLSFIGAYLALPLSYLIISFERNGEAGHFRTLVNQLMSFSLDQVKLKHLQTKYVIATFLSAFILLWVHSHLPWCIHTFLGAFTPSLAHSHLPWCIHTLLECIHTSLGIFTPS